MSTYLQKKIEDDLPELKYDVAVNSWDDVVYLGRDNIQRIIDKKEEDIAESEEIAKNMPSSDNWHNDQLDLKYAVKSKLERLIVRAERKPILPFLRSDEHFKVGEDAVLYIPTAYPGHRFDGYTSGFFKGIVVEGRKQDRQVGFESDTSFYSGDPMWDSGMTYIDYILTSYVMLKSEFDYLKSNLGFAKIWVGNADARQFVADLQEEIVPSSYITLRGLVK